MPTRNRQMFASATGEHNTPLDIIEAARAVLGGTIDCDPATNMQAQAYIQATNFYVDPATDFRLGANGLTDPWHGETAWLNPPFTTVKRDINGNAIQNKNGSLMRERVIKPWVDRWVLEMCKRVDRVSDYLPQYRCQRDPHYSHNAAGLLLVPARTDTQWFKPLFQFPLCFIEGRLHFSEADQGATFPTVIVYAGRHVTRFNTIFENFGTCGIFSDLIGYSINAKPVLDITSTSML